MSIKDDKEPRLFLKIYSQQFPRLLLPAVYDFVMDSSITCSVFSFIFMSQALSF